jgi:dTDP-glucose pyrophosphorylase
MNKPTRRPIHLPDMLRISEVFDYWKETRGVTERDITDVIDDMIDRNESDEIVNVEYGYILDLGVNESVKKFDDFLRDEFSGEMVSDNYFVFWIDSELHS